MSRIALEDTRHELIKAHIIDPEHSPLPEELQELLNRIVSVSKVLDKNPVMRNAVAIHQVKYPEISKSTAYSDVRMAIRLFNTIHSFDFDFYQTWLINDIVVNIQKCRATGSEKDRRIIAMEHANLLKAIGEKPENLPDPLRNEKHQFYVLIQNNNQQIKVELNNLKDLPTAALQELNRLIYGGNEITEGDAEQLMKT
ncbi:MAG: hypothetical protein JZU47_10155 [Prolixibacteraceae bacterium]|nr:hypothetical protein [Prolixibacteraceae bacterium]